MRALWRGVGCALFAVLVWAAFILLVASVAQIWMD